MSKYIKYFLNYEHELSTIILLVYCFNRKKILLANKKAK